MPPKVIRDPVHNHIYLDRHTDKLILELLECREVQRLRRIHQLGVSYLTYPGAEHSRFSHSLGVCHLMKHALSHVSTHHDRKVRLSKLERTAALAAALLHDIGHAPFSHVLEKDFVGSHEQQTIRLLKDRDSEVHAKLKAHSRMLPGLVEGIITGQLRDLLWLRALLSSQLDVDRMDYLLRDSHFCGVGYGRYDHEYIFHTMRIRSVLPDGVFQPVWLYKARHVIEEYLFARYYMHWNVYYHRTTKGYEELLKAICERAGDLMTQGTKLSGSSTVLKFVARKTLSPTEYVLLDDHAMMAQIAAWQDTQDAVLRDLCGRFLNRRGFKPVDQREDAEDSQLEYSEAIAAVKDSLRTRDIDPKYYFRESAPSAKAYDYYHPEKAVSQRTAENSILIEQGDNQFEEISSIPGMERLKAVTGRRERRRYFYVLEEHRGAVKETLGLK